MKTTLLVLAVVVLTGCGAMPVGQVPFYLPPPTPMQFHPIQTQRPITTNCFNTGAGEFRCVTR